MPGWSRERQETTWTKPHRRLFHMIGECGFQVVSEFRVGKYSLDGFSQEIWIGFEADGRMAHQYRREKDLVRDEWIFEHAGIPVLRIDEQALRKVCWDETKVLILAFVSQYEDTIAERKEKGQWVLL